MYDCIKGKQTNIKKFGIRQSSKVLDLVYTNICGPFPIAFWNDHKYFITFTDDYSFYGWVPILDQREMSITENV